MEEVFSTSFLLKFIKFGIVGFSGVVVDFSITFVCKEFLKIQKYVANAIGFTVAASTNYFLNRVWTFESTNPDILMEFSRFFIIALIGLGINMAIVWAMTAKMKVNFYLSKVVATIVVTAWNFLINAYYTFA